MEVTMTLHDVTATVPELGIAMIGSGLMAKSHTMGYRNVESVYGTHAAPAALRGAGRRQRGSRALAVPSHLGYARYTTDWRDALTDPDVDVVDIVTPNFLHFDIAMAAIEAGKHVYCEKPLALNAADARQMYEAAEKAGVKTLVGFNYLRNPAIAEARRLISSGRARRYLDLPRPVRPGCLQRPGRALHLALRAQALRQRSARRPRRPHHLAGPGRWSDRSAQWSA